MSSNNRGADPAARESRPWMARGACISTSLALALLVMGCGRESLEQTDGSSEGHAEAIAIPASAPAQPASSGVQLEDRSRTEAAGPKDGVMSVATGVAPDVVVAAVDTLVAPGEVVELTAEATADVVEMALSDGRGPRQPFAYDSTAAVWRTSYRVPLRPSADNVGLSVTAKTAAKRWRRVWIFLKIAP
jgi:hypothetical protein